MVKKEGLLPVGKLSKIHGTEGYITLVLSEFAQDLFFEPEVLWLTTAKSGEQPVPFFIADSRTLSSSKVRVQFVDYESIDQVSPLQGANALLEVTKEQLEEAKRSTGDFEGYQISSDGQNIGIIETIYDFSGNRVFGVIGAGQDEIMIPGDDDLIINIDHDTRSIEIELAEGLLDVD